MDSATCDYEKQRLKRIEDNRARLAELGIKKQTTILQGMFQAQKPASQRLNKPRTYTKKPVEAPRTSSRLQGKAAPAYADLSELLDDHREGTYSCRIPSLEKNVTPAEDKKEQYEALMKIRCSSKGRGSLYDSVVGISCHFCRQKKLCAEDNCKRCETRDPALPCIGKSECSKCHSPYGKFCRACLLIRYGEQLETVLADPEWTCPHCYELEHPEEHWICNSSICLTRRKMKPTGIAIFEAHARGFPSVGHWLQAQLKHAADASLPPPPPPPPRGLPPTAPSKSPKGGSTSGGTYKAKQCTGALATCEQAASLTECGGFRGD